MAEKENTTKWDRILDTLSAVKDWGVKEYQEGPLSLSEFKEKEVKHLKDVAKGTAQFGIETLGLINRLMPTTGLGTADPDYYGIKDFITETFLPSGHEGGITVPYNEIQENPDFMEHMKSLINIEQNNLLNNLEENTGLDLSEVRNDPINSGNLLMDMINDVENVSDENANKISDFLNNARNNPMFDYVDDEGSITSPKNAAAVTFNYLPKVDEGIFGMDMTLDPQFTSKGDMSLPGLGTFGMRDGKLTQLAASTMRPLDEMLMEGSPGAQWAKENITDKIAWQGPAMHQPEGTGMGYQIPMWLGLARGAVGAGKGIMGAGKMAYKYPRTTAGVGIPSAIFGKKLFASDEE